MPPSRTAPTSKQTRLSFNPVPSSSPQAAGLPAALKSRAAAVRFDIQGVGKQRFTEAAPSKGYFDSSSEDDDMGSSSSKVTAPTGPIGNSPFESLPDGLPRRSARSNTPQPRPVDTSQRGAGGHARDYDMQAFSSDSSLPTLEPLFPPSKKGREKMRVSTTQIKGGDGADEDPSDNEDLPNGYKRPKRRGFPSGSTRRQAVSISSDESGKPYSDDTGVVYATSSRNQDVERESTDSTSTRTLSSTRVPSEEIMEEPPSRSRRKHEDIMSLDYSPVGEIVIPKPVRKQKYSLRSSQKPKDIPSRMTRSSGRKGKLPQTEVFELGESEKSENGNSESSEDEVVQSPTKRRRLERAVKETPLRVKLTRKDRKDLQKDLDFVQSTADIVEERTRGKARPSKRALAQKHLERLKRARAGGQLEEISSDEPNPPADGSDEGTEMETPDESGDEAGPAYPPYSVGLDEYEPDFLDDSSANNLGIEEALYGRADIPLEFTHHAHKKPKEHFRDAVEWMVHNKLNPAFPRADSLYKAAFRRLDDEVQGYAGSKFISSAWVPDFSRAIKARPEFLEVGLEQGRKMTKHCDACNRSNHPASCIISFGGSPYDPESLEPIPSEPDSSDSSGDEITSRHKSRRSHKKPLRKKEKIYRDAIGNRLPPPSKLFYVGRFCKANATIAHSLLHWRYHLNEWVTDFLRVGGYTSDEQILLREGWSARKRGNYANKVVDEMERGKDIASLYRDFKNNLDKARDFKPEKLKY